MPDIRVKIEGSQALEAKLRDPQFIKGPLRRFLLRSALTVEAKAKEEAPVDTGRYRASIKHQIEPLRAIVGSHVAYAPVIEYGSKPHWPPVGALQPWARRHGFPAGARGDFLVRRAISRKGTRARWVFTNALKESMGKIHGFLRSMEREILNHWRRSGQV